MVGQRGRAGYESGSKAENLHSGSGDRGVLGIPVLGSCYASFFCGMASGHLGQPCKRVDREKNSSEEKLGGVCSAGGDLGRLYTVPVERGNLTVGAG